MNKLLRPTALKDAVLVSIDEVNSDILYTNKHLRTFNARNVLEYSLSDKAKADYEAISADIAGGTPERTPLPNTIQMTKFFSLGLGAYFSLRKHKIIEPGWRNGSRTVYFT